MSQASVRAIIAAEIGGVTNVGLVHDYERWAVLWPDFLSKFKTTISAASVIRGWTITCSGWADTVTGFRASANEANIMREYRFTVRGYIGLADADETEHTAIALAETVCNRLNTSAALHDLARAWGRVPVCNLTAFEARMFGNVLCHYAQIDQVVPEHLILT